MTIDYKFNQFGTLNRLDMSYKIINKFRKNMNYVKDNIF